MDIGSTKTGNNDALSKKKFPDDLPCMQNLPNDKTTGDDLSCMQNLPNNKTTGVDVHCRQLLPSDKATEDNVFCRHDNNRTTTKKLHDVNSQSLTDFLSVCHDLNNQDGNGATSLMLAVAYENEPRTRVLIKRGANVNMQDHSGKTALMYAARHDNANIFRLLTETGADINIQDSAGKTVLMHACYMGSKFFCQHLIASPCNLNLQDKYGKTALMHAVLSNSITCHIMCESHADVNVQDNQGMTALMHAAKNGSELCRALIKINTDLNLRDNIGMTALIHAASMFHLKTCELLIQKKADLAVLDNTGRTALINVICKILYYPTLYNDKVIDALQVADLLIDHGSEVIFGKGHNSVFEMESRVKCGLTLGNVIKQRQNGLVHLLVCNGIMDAEFVNPETENRMFSSVVECAASFGRYDLITYFFEKCYLTENDMNYFRRAAVARSRQKSSTCSSRQSQDCSCQTAGLNNIVKANRVLQKAASVVWPLSKLALITVISSLGPSPGRADRVDRIPLPKLFKRQLLFQD